VTITAMKNDVEPFAQMLSHSRKRVGREERDFARGLASRTQ